MPLLESRLGLAVVRSRSSAAWLSAHLIFRMVGTWFWTWFWDAWDMVFGICWDIELNGFCWVFGWEINHVFFFEKWTRFFLHPCCFSLLPTNMTMKSSRGVEQLFSCSSSPFSGFIMLNALSEPLRIWSGALKPGCDHAKCCWILMDIGRYWIGHQFSKN